MKTKRAIVITSSLLFLLICLIIPVAESYKAYANSEMDFLSIMSSAFTDPPEGSILNKMAAVLGTFNSKTTQAPRGGPIPASSLAIQDHSSLESFAPKFPNSGTTDLDMLPRAVSRSPSNVATGKFPSAGGTNSSGGFLGSGAAGSNAFSGGDSSVGRHFRGVSHSGGGSAGSTMALNHRADSARTSSSDESESEKANQASKFIDSAVQPKAMLTGGFSGGSGSGNQLPLATNPLSNPSDPLPNSHFDNNAGQSNNLSANAISGIYDNPFSGLFASTMPFDFSKGGPMTTMPAMSNDMRAPEQFTKEITAQLTDETNGVLGLESATALETPEPATLALVSCGLVGLFFLTRKHKAG